MTFLARDPGPGIALTFARPTNEDPMRRSGVAIAAGLIALAFPGVAISQTILQKSQKDEIIQVPDGDAAMAEAFRKARATLPEFLALARVPRRTMTGMAVKVAVRDANANEFFWITGFTQRDGKYAGRIDNTPRSVKSVREGDVITFAEAEIVDWLYRENGKMKGNYTACALLSREPPQDQIAFKKQIGLDCD
jgi:uncharacterized protein YegJ (DUF2314 family)